MIGTVPEWAARHQISRQTANQRIRTHNIPKLADGTIDFEVADRIWAEVKNPVQQSRVAGRDRAFSDGATTGSRPTATTLSTLAAAQMRRELVRLEKDTVLLGRIKGQLVDRAAVFEAAFERARAERDAWVNWPIRISAMLAAELNVEERTLRLALEREVRTHLIERSKESPISLPEAS